MCWNVLYNSISRKQHYRVYNYYLIYNYYRDSQDLKVDSRIPYILWCEVESAIKSMNKWKASGEDTDTEEIL